MSKIRDAQEKNIENKIIQQMDEELEKTDMNESTIKTSTNIMKESMKTHETMNNNLVKTKELLKQLKITANFESVVYYSALTFYICVIVYIILDRTLIKWFFDKQQN